MPPVRKAVSALFGRRVIEQWNMLLWSRQDLWLHAAEHILGFNCRKTYKYECICLYHWPLPLSWQIYLFLLLPVTYFDCKYFIPYLLTKFLLQLNFFYWPFHTPLYWVTPNLHETKCSRTHQDEVRFFPPVIPLLPCCLRLGEPVSNQAVGAGDLVGNRGHFFLQKCLGGSCSV